MDKEPECSQRASSFNSLKKCRRGSLKTDPSHFASPFPPGAMSSFPPCVRDTRQDGTPSTVVVKMRTTKAAVQWVSVSTMPGLEARAVALVHLQKDVDLETGFMYMVLTPVKVSTFQNYQKHLQRKLEAPPIEAAIEWVRPLDRRLQRLFDWGDCWMEHDSIAQAVAANDTSELALCFPSMRYSIDIGHTEHLPSLAAGQPGLLALTDSTTEEYRQKLYLEHELNGTHSFGEPGKNWECTVCDRMPAAKCVCGAQRCSRHNKPVEPRHKVAWTQRQVGGAPFYVQDPKWMRKEIQVEWIRDELDDNSSLEDFAAVYLKLLGNRSCDEKRRVDCLDLYRVYNPSFKAKKECDLSPFQLREFQRVFDSKAPLRCLWCNTAMEQQQEYCSQACTEAANPPQKCQKCGSEDWKILHCPRGTQGARCAALNGMAKCKGCGFTEFCQIVAGHQRSKRKNAAPVHWTKRRRS
jgi:hypothetical protein